MKKTNTDLRMSRLERENARLAAENERLRADMDYLAMMTDVEIEEDNDEPEV